MNVIFHTTTAIGVTVLLTDTNRLGVKPTIPQILPTALYAFSLSIISHGVLDYVPHCYPLNSKLDVIAAFVMILFITRFTNGNFRIVMGLSFLGAILPDLIDHTPELLNKYFPLGLAVHQNIFPWHWPEYSGSIYDGNCNVSALNHIFLILTLVVTAWTRWTDLRQVFRR